MNLPPPMIGAALIGGGEILPPALLQPPCPALLFFYVSVMILGIHSVEWRSMHEGRRILFLYTDGWIQATVCIFKDYMHKSSHCREKPEGFHLVQVIRIKVKRSGMLVVCQHLHREKISRAL